MAPRAAARLESLGFRNVFEYKAGKQDWLAAGLPAAGRRADEPTIAAVLRRDVPRFGLEDHAGPIVDAMRASGWEWAAVVDAGGLLLGRIRASEVTRPEATARDVMEEGPSTYRPNVRLEELLRRMLDQRFEMAFVTDPDGRLRGLVTRRDIARALDAHRKAS
jgi:CBS domain-containing protein